MVAQDRVKEGTVRRWGARCWWGNLQSGWRGSSWHWQPQPQAEAALASPITKDGPRPKCKPCSQSAVPRHQVLISRMACGGTERVGKCPMPWGDSLSFCSIPPSKVIRRTALAKHSKQTQSRITQSLGLVMCYKACRGLISDMAGSSQHQAYGTVWLRSALHREENETLPICCEWGLGSGYHPALLLCTRGDRLLAKLQLSGAQLLWEKVHWSTPSCSPWLSLPSPCHVSLPLLLWKLWAEYFRTLEYFQICRLTEIHVIYV